MGDFLFNTWETFIHMGDFYILETFFIWETFSLSNIFGRLFILETFYLGDSLSLGDFLLCKFNLGDFSFANN